MSDEEYVRSRWKRAELDNHTQSGMEQVMSIEPETLIALGMLHDACAYLREGWDLRMSREESQANLGARAILFNCSNQIFREHDCPISKEEVVGAAILERALSG